MKRSDVDCEMKAGYRNWRTISRSVTLDRTDVIDIGRKSDSSLGLAVLATGQIEARFHWDGTTEADNDRLISCARGFANTAAPSLVYIATADKQLTPHRLKPLLGAN